MRYQLIPAALLLALAPTLPAVAAESVPDLTGTWTVTFEAVGFRKPAENGQPSHYARSIDSSFSIDWQDGHRGAGHEIDEKSSTAHPLVTGEQIAGVIGWDGATLQMVDDNGFHDCRILSPESMRCVYRHVLPERSDIALSAWTKQK